MSDIPPRIDRAAVGFDIIDSVVKLAKAAQEHPRGRDILIGLAFAIDDLARLVEDKSDRPDHARMVVQIMQNVAQPDGIHANKVSKALGL